MVKYLRGKWTPYDGLAVLVREYYAALQERRPPPVSAEEALRTMEIMDEAWKQMP